MKDLWLEQLPMFVERYEPWDTHTADETCLFYGCLLDRMLTMKGHGVKNATERTTVLPYINNDGSNRWVPNMV
jgi:hypothetical protein